MKIVFATNNQHKLDEIAKISKGELGFLSLSDINCHEDIPETGSTLRENALLKAQFVKNNYGFNCFADDTGLEVASLNNAPGIYSARYAGPSCNAEDNMQKLLGHLQDKKDRSAQFRTVIALLLDKEMHFFEGIVRGEITYSKEGSNGFGYDPIFRPNGYSKTFGELPEEVKNSLSHRAIATQKLVEFLLNHKQTR